MTTKVDHAALRVNQASIIALLAIAFVANALWLVAFVAAVMVVGTIWPQAGLFKLAYARVLRPAGILKPDLRDDDPQPHLFAQGLGGIFLVFSTLFLWLNLSLVGWLLAGIVVVLAAVNLFLQFCLGCFIYYQLERAGIHAALPSWQPAQRS